MVLVGLHIFVFVVQFVNNINHVCVSLTACKLLPLTN
jgi:hypothetical protein